LWPAKELRLIRIDKLTDYGLVLLSCMARTGDASLRTARDLALESGLRLPTVSRLLQDLLKGGLLTSQRGIKGGYALARKPREISIGAVITALEGPIALTVCSSGITGLCDLEPGCAIKNNQRVISEAIRGVLERLTLADLLQPLRLMTIEDASGRSLPAIGTTERIQ
jgi:FeS assembly SUF system regulator